MTIDEAVVVRVRAQWALDQPVVLPTDTVYGLVVPAVSERAVARIFDLKDRPVDRRMAVLVSDLEQAGEWIELTEPIRRLAHRYWPGPLTLVGPRRPPAPEWVGDAATLAVRCPDDDLLRALAAEAGPLAATSANRHGDPTPKEASAVAAALPAVSLVIDGGSRHGAASTVVVMTGNGPEVVREGIITAADISAALAPRS